MVKKKQPRESKTFFEVMDGRLFDTFYKNTMDGLNPGNTGDSHIMIVAEKDAQLIGFAHLIPKADDELFVARVEVHPQHRQGGQGSRLLETAFAIASENDRAVVFPPLSGEAEQHLWRVAQRLSARSSEPTVRHL